MSTDLFSSERHVYNVSELNREVRQLLEDGFSAVWVEGEISNLSMPRSGHIYFTLKDDKAQLRCAFFKTANASLDFNLEDGLGCVVFGRVSLYEQAGQYQLYVQRIEPRGKGALQLAFEQLKKKLEQEGLFDPARKRPLPFLPQRIGVVTSATGAAFRDILNVINRRFANVHIVLRPALVQGKAAGQDIAQAIAELNEYGQLDVLIVGRGGGSLEDLWPFNEEIVARAVCASRIPVISAVGHEIDFTICDFVADVRAPTPSAAAELVVREKAQLHTALLDQQRRLQGALSEKIKMAQMRLSRVLRSYALRRPQVIMEQYSQRVDNAERSLRSRWQHRWQWYQQNVLRLAGRLRRPDMVISQYGRRISLLATSLDRQYRHCLQNKQSAVERVSSRLYNLNPLAVLSRGYSVTTSVPDGAVIKDAAMLKQNDCIKTKVHKGVIISRVEDCRHEG